MTDRSATTIWQGDLASGSGQTTLDSTGAAGPFEVSWPARTEDPKDKTSPEELVAAAHASCFSMALSNGLSKAGHTVERLETQATVSFSTEGGAHVAGIVLRVRGTIPGLDAEGFRKHAETAKDGCPISKLVAGNTELSLQAELA